MQEKLIKDVLTGGNHLTSFLIGRGCMPDVRQTYEAVQREYGLEVGDVWVAWRAIMELSIYRRSL